TKTDYEIALTRVACERAAEGHRAAHGCFLDGGSERDVTLAYLRAADQLEADLPYDAIVAFDEKAAVLHYENKRGADAAPGRLLLLDAGAGHHGYASDISRTWTVDDAPDAMRALVEGVDALERRLVEAIAPGRDFAELHLEAHRGVAELLHEVGIVRSSPAEAVDRQLTRAFFPHGIGHGLGLAVHEVGGRLADPDGGERTPPDGHVLRTTRRLEPGHLVTIEPGLYFIPMLLEPWRQGADAAVVDWDLVDQLTPFGGVRIEDDVLCTDDGFEDLTRPLLAGPRGV
ncbi:MAG: M24 family metallopeptidase, partial [Acidobacteriota bacterium]